VYCLAPPVSAAAGERLTNRPSGWTPVRRLLCARMAPSPTYLAMRAYERGRMLRARLSRPPAWTGVRVLGYHRIADDGHDLSVRPDAFRAQVEHVLEAGLRPVRLDRALDLLAGPVEGRRVAVTFDDAYRDNLTEAVPVLRELDVPATIFVPTAIVDGTASYTWYAEPPPALSWEEIGELEAEGLVDFQSHTLTHPRLPHVDDDRAREEIAGSKRALEERLGREVTSFCYPAGLWGERDARLVREAGYRAGVTTDPGVNPGGGPMDRLRRTLVYHRDGPFEFAAKVAGHLDRPPALRALLYRRLARA
jgi:peptidoglycan/xylan/chitin deacetylase (PgdA/CDA1 family)